MPLVSMTCLHRARRYKPTARQETNSTVINALMRLSGPENAADRRRLRHRRHFGFLSELCKCVVVRFGAPLLFPPTSRDFTIQKKPYSNHRTAIDQIVNFLEAAVLPKRVDDLTGERDAALCRRPLQIDSIHQNQVLRSSNSHGDRTDSLDTLPDKILRFCVGQYGHIWKNRRRSRSSSGARQATFLSSSSYTTSV